MNTLRRRKYILLGIGMLALLAGAAVVHAGSRSSEDEEALKKLREAERAYDAVPDAKRIPVHDPAKFSDPIGVDDQGRAFPLTRKSSPPSR